MNSEAQKILHTVFHWYDRDCNGYISRSEMPAVLEDLGFKIGDSTDLGCHHKQAFIDRAFELADKNGDGKISFNEFAEYHGRISSMLEALKRSDLSQKFKRASTKGPGEPLSP